MANCLHINTTAELRTTATTGGDRLDRYLAQQYPQFSRSYLQKLISQGYVRVHQQVQSDKNYAVQTGDVILLSIPPAQPLTICPQAIPLDIVFEDEELLVVNKPVGLVVHPAPGHSDHTLVNALLAHCPTLSGINGTERPGIVHRLDKDTSGLMVVAKTDRAHQDLQRQIQQKTAQRRYLGIVEGVPKLPKGTIDAPIARHPSDRQKMAVVPTGRPAITHWQLVEKLRHHALLQFDLATGRTHQIRVHAAYMGHAIANDPVYGHPNKTTQKYLPGQALHAWQLHFQHPSTGQTLSFQVDPPEGFQRLLQNLR